MKIKDKPLLIWASSWNHDSKIWKNCFLFTVRLDLPINVGRGKKGSWSKPPKHLLRAHKHTTMGVGKEGNILRILFTDEKAKTLKSEVG